MRTSSNYLAAIVGALMFGQTPKWDAPVAPPATPPRRRRHAVRRLWPFGRSNQHPHDGHQERARRRAQIERGQLTGSNGLVVAPRED